MPSSFRSAWRGAIGLSIFVGFSVAAPVACLSGYVFDLPPGAGGSGSASTLSTSTSTGVSTNSGMGGSGASTSTTSPASTGASMNGSTSSSSSGVVACTQRDCSNPACAESFSCVPTTPPTGWTGYFELYDGVPSSLPSCTGEWPMQGYQGGNNLKADPATCNCACTPPSGGACQIPELDVNDGTCTGSAFCTGPVNPPTSYAPGNCFDFPASSSSGGFLFIGGDTCGPNAGSTCQSGSDPCNVSATAGVATVTGSSCAASANPTTTQPTFASNGQACGGPTPGTGCGASDTCLPIPQPPFNGGLCIMQTGDVSCPAVQFTTKHTFYASTGADTRTCTGCTCGSSTDESCGVTWTLYSDATTPPKCTTLQLTVEAGKCAGFTGNLAMIKITSAKATITQQPNGGSCPPSAGTPTGSVMAEDPTTFCCTM